MVIDFFNLKSTNHDSINAIYLPISNEKKSEEKFLLEKEDTG